MRLANKEEFKKISIRSLNFSTRTYNALMRAGISTLYLLVENLDNLQNIRQLGKNTVSEIRMVLSNLAITGIPYPIEAETSQEDRITEEKSNKTLNIPAEILSRPITDMNIPIRAINCFRQIGVQTIGQACEMSDKEILNIEFMGITTLKEFRKQLKNLSEKGEGYFKRADSAEKKEKIPCQEKKDNNREIDVNTVKKLRDGYDFSVSILSEWYGVTKQRIFQKLEQRNRGCWVGKELEKEDRAIITGMIGEVTFFKERDGVKCYLYNNKTDDCAFIIVTKVDIKCFFLKDLPPAIQAYLKSKNMHSHTKEELSLKNRFGQKVSILKKQYFIPENIHEFRKFANKRGLTPNEYSQFLYGVPMPDHNTSITDEKIVAFLNENTYGGITSIPSISENQWIRRFISQSPFNTDEFISFYGFRPRSTYEKIEEITEYRFDDVEKDMRSYNDGRNEIEIIYANNPLIGSAVLSKDYFDEISKKSKTLIEKQFNVNGFELSLKDKMTITLTVISYAKEWSGDDDNYFWSYITSQFGYRDDSGRLRNLLCACINDALVKNGRWFIISSGKRRYKATILAHAFSTKQSWFSFCDFLFDFYKNNLKWKYVPDDPMISRMIIALRSKLLDADNNTDEDIRLGSRIVNFRQGIVKLIIYRPKYAAKLVESILCRIDGIINQNGQAASCYEDIICDKWMENKIHSLTVRNANRESIEKRAVATDYSRIAPLYRLENEEDIKIVFPDIRLEKNDFSSLKLEVYYDEVSVEERKLSYYGDEFGKTIIGFNIDLDDYLRRAKENLIKPQVIISCDSEQIYNSKNLLYRNWLVFRNKTEINICNCEKGNYSLFVPSSNSIDFDNVDVSEIKRNQYIEGYYLELYKDYVIRINEEIVTCDTEQATKDIRVLKPRIDYPADYILNGKRYCIISGKEKICIKVEEADNINQYCVSTNERVYNLSTFPCKTFKGTNIIEVLFQSLDTSDFSFQVIDLNNNKIVFSENYKVLQNFSYSFNRPYYFSLSDYQEAKLQIVTPLGVQDIKFSNEETSVNVPVEEGICEIQIPIIKVIDNTQKIWSRLNYSWIKNIPQECFINVILPEGVEADLNLGEHPVSYEGKGVYALGNTLYGISEYRKEWIELRLLISCKDYLPQEYLLSRISCVERFIEMPILKCVDNQLVWNSGLGFLGDYCEYFNLKICQNTKHEKDYKIKVDEEIIDEDLDLPIGEYSFSISKPSVNLFATSDQELVSSTFFVGDENELRFVNAIIELEAITFEENNNYNTVQIRPSFIDNIKFHGVQFVFSENRECPVYSGTMYFITDNGIRREYSYKDRVNSKGRQLYKVNPVRIVFINETTLSITNEDEDGLYYNSYNDRITQKKFTQITDHEATEYNIKNYYLADLYLYKKRGGTV